jgi:hypothetical protein
MSMILSWALFPLVLAAIGLGWGALVQWVAGDRKLGPLTIPLGLAAAIVVAGGLTAFSGTASIAAPVTAIGALAGVGYIWGRARLGAAPAIAAVGVLLVYGAPVILSGQATFLGYIRLDDTATWFNLIDQLFSHGRSFPEPLSTFKLLAETNLATFNVPGSFDGSAYPSGAFMLLGVGHWVTGIDIAWVFQPYLACCAAALSLSIYGLLERLLEWRWLRAFVAFVAPLSALLYGYAAWGGIKELTAAFLLALTAALVARLIASEEIRWRNTLSLAVAGGALMITLGPGSVIYGAPTLAALFLLLTWRSFGGRAQIVPFAVVVGVAVLVIALVAIFGTHAAIYIAPVGIGLVCVLVGLTVGASGFTRLFLKLGVVLVATAACGFPLWLLIGHYLQVDGGSTISAQNPANSPASLGNLVGSLRALQISGIWPAGDFRDVAAAPGLFAAPSSLARYGFAYLTFVAGVGGVLWSLWKRRPEVALYALVALVGVVAPWLDSYTPWLVGKALAISSPAILLAGLVGGALLFRQDRTWALVAGAVILVALGAGVLWSDWLQYRDVTLAPRDQLSELQTIGAKLAGKGPTFFNEYQIYGDRHFLRAGAPVEPAEYRQGPSENLPTVTGAVLTKSAFADIDSFPLSTLRPYKSLVIRTSPVESEPPSIYGYKPVWQGRYYQLWQQPATPTHRVIRHVPLGDTTLDYCGAAEFGQPTEPLCSIKPAAVAPCPEVLSLANLAAQDGGELLAYERANPIVLRGTDTTWPSSWTQDYDASGQPEQALSATAPGTAVAHVLIPTGPHRYKLWLGGGFDRGFVVHVDGRLVGSVSNELNNLGDYNEVGEPFTLDAGTHTISITYPQPNLAPGNADSENYTSLAEIALQPLGTQSRLVTVKPSQARELCGRTLDWIEAIAPEN